MKYILNSEINQREISIESFLKSRGVESPLDYLSPSENSENDPASLDNIDEGYRLIKKHLDRDSNFFLIIDADGDGVTSAAIIYNYLKRISPNIKIKWCAHEGKSHGVDSIDMIPEDTDLLIIPDAGSNQYEIHRELNEMGVDILILDHHIYNTEIPTPAVIINNQFNYANRDLTGAGVVYKFCEYLDRQLGLNEARDFIDLAAVGIIGDMADLRNIETRYIVKEGLSNITNYGLKTFVKKQEYPMGGVVSPIGIAFYITPLINAIIRVGTIEEKEILFRAFIEGDSIVPSTKRGSKSDDTEIIAEQAIRLATNARSRQKKILESGLDYLIQKVEKEELNLNKILLIKLDEDEEELIPPSITGLFAMQLLQRYNKPCLIGRRADGGCIKGSIRGDDKFELDNLRGYLLSTGYFEFVEGHDNSAGFSIKETNIDKFLEKSNNELDDYNFKDSFFVVDYSFSPSDFSKLKELIFNLGRYKTMWGRGIEEPVILIKNIPLNTSDFTISIVGSNKDTIRISNGEFTFIKFKAKNDLYKLDAPDGYIINLIGTPQINEYYGKETPQIIIDEFEVVYPKREF